MVTMLKLKSCLWCLCLSLLWLWALLVVVHGFEFDRDSCHSLLPNQKLHLVDNGKSSNSNNNNNKREYQRNFHHPNDHDYAEEQQHEEDDEEEGEEDKDKGWPTTQDDDHDMESNRARYRLKPAVGRAPFNILTSQAIYRRNRHLTVTIEGPEFNAFILMARSAYSAKPQPVGTFEAVPASAKYLHCLSHHDTVISRDTGGKSNINFQWKAPDDDKGSLKFTATVVQKDVYWSHLESKPVIFNQFPPSFAECGKTKSCYRYSTKMPNCSPELCDYVVITQVNKDHNEIEFTIGGVMDNSNGYVGIGFTLDKFKLTHMDLSVCLKNGKVVDTKQYTIENWNSGPREYSKVEQVEDTDKDGQMIWCQYSRPLKGPGPQLADLTQTLHHAFLWGSLNETTGLPILPSKSDILFVPNPWNYSQTINMMHYVGAGAAAANSHFSPLHIMQLALLSILLILQFANNAFVAL